MNLLPVDQWQVIFHPDCFAIAAHQNNGALHWTKFEYSDLPSPRIVSSGGSNTLENHFTIKDLERVIVDMIDGRSVEQRPASIALDLA